MILEKNRAVALLSKIKEEEFEEIVNLLDIPRSSLPSHKRGRVVRAEAIFEATEKTLLYSIIKKVVPEIKIC